MTNTGHIHWKGKSQHAPRVGDPSGGATNVTDIDQSIAREIPDGAGKPRDGRRPGVTPRPTTFDAAAVFRPEYLAGGPRSDERGYEPESSYALSFCSRTRESAARRSPATLSAAMHCQTR